jgi:hypothetical protein
VNYFCIVGSVIREFCNNMVVQVELFISFAGIRKIYRVRLSGFTAKKCSSVLISIFSIFQSEECIEFKSCTTVKILQIGIRRGQQEASGILKNFYCFHLIQAALTQAKSAAVF